MHNGKNLLVKAIILSFTFVVGVFVMSAAWFTNSQTATASGLSVKVHKDLGLQISDDNNTWNTELTYNNDSLPLVTSSDGKTFSKPLLHLTTGETTGESNPATAETDYIQKTVYFRSEVPMTVSVSELTVTPVVDTLSLEEATETNRKSPYGNFSKDYIAAAARVSISNETTTQVYDPNPNIELKNYGSYADSAAPADGEIVIFTDKNCYFSLQATSSIELSDMPISMNSSTYKGSPIPEQMFIVHKTGSYYKFESLAHKGMSLNYDSSSKKFDLTATDSATLFTIENGSLKVPGENVYLSYDGNSFVAVETAPATATVKMLTSGACEIVKNGTAESNEGVETDIASLPTVTLTKGDEDAEYYTGNITINIWAEGTDRDALVPLMGGKFNTSITFTGNVITGS